MGGVALALMALLAAPAAAQDEVDAAPTATTAVSSLTLLELLDRLDSPDLRTRETATLELSARGAEIGRELSDEQIRALTPEQRARLTTILRQRFFATTRAGLGVSFRPLIEEGAAAGVRIDLVVDGFPASEFLQPGDVIVEIDGESLVDAGEVRADTPLRHAILSHDPGDVLDMVVRRGEEELELTVPTGSFEDLRNAQTPNARLLQGAWEWRMERLGLVEEGVIGLSADQLREWKTGAQARRDIPDIAPGGRGGALLAAERSVPRLAKVADSDQKLERRRLAVTSQLRQIERRLLEQQQELAQTRRDLQGALAGSKEAQRLRAAIQSLEQQSSSDRTQRKRLMAMLAEMRSATD